MLIEMRGVDGLKPHPSNYNEHGESQLGLLEESIEDDGVYRNVVVSSDGYLLAGHGLVEAAKRKGLTEVPVHVRPYPHDDERALRLLVRDNRSSDPSAERGPTVNPIKLLSLLDPMPLEQLSSVGFEPMEVELIRTGANNGEEDAREDPGAQEVEGPVYSKRGEVYALGRHRVMCGDATQIADWETLLQGERPELLLTDPPYNVGLEYGDSTDDDRDEDAYANWTREWFDLARTMTERQIVTPGNDVELWAGYGQRGWVGTWHKSNSMARGKVSQYLCAEPLVFFGKPGGNRPHSDLFEHAIGDQSGVGDHPCPKPLSLWEDLVQHYAGEGPVMDCFLGSGTTVIACEKQKQVALGLEWEPRYVDVTRRRFANFVEDEAYLPENSGPVEV